MKLEYMRKREEREERESHQRREMEKLRLDREKAEFDHKQTSANMKQKTDKAIVSCYFLFCLVHSMTIFFFCRNFSEILQWTILSNKQLQTF